MRIISWNTNGLRATHKQGHLDPLFREYNPDILCLQETKATREQLPVEVTDVFGYELYMTWPTIKKGYSGVAIYTKEHPIKVTYGIAAPGIASATSGNESLDDEGRTVTAEYKDFYLINCYFPNGGGAPERLTYKLAFYEQFLKYADKLQNGSAGSPQGKPVIFCGDVNVAHTEIDLARPKENATHVGFLPVERAWMDKLVSKGWVDVFRTLHPDKTEVYTYWDQQTAARNRNVGWRIDYFFVSPSLMPKVTDFQTLADYYGSDHCPILLDITL